MRKYLRKNSWGTATLQDFLSAQEAASGVVLESWAELWLKTKGLNVLVPHLDCKEGEVTSAWIEQQNARFAESMRPHRTQIGFYKIEETAGKKTFANTMSEKVSIEGSTTLLPQLTGKPCPDAFLLNEGDHDFARIQYSEATLKSLEEAFPFMTDPFTRLQVWTTFAGLVRNGAMAPHRYLKFLTHNIVDEKDSTVVASLLRTVDGRTRGALSVGMILENDLEALTAFESAVSSLLEHAAPGSDMQRTVWDSWARTAVTPQALTRMKAVLEGSVSVPGFTLDADRRWAVILKLHELGARAGLTPENLKQLRESELARDGSAVGKKRVLQAEAMVPDPINKSRWITEITQNPRALSYDQLREIAWVLFPPGQTDLMRGLRAELQNKVVEMNDRGNIQLAGAFASELSGMTCDADSVASLTRLIESRPQEEWKQIVYKKLVQARFASERCIIARSWARSLAQGSPALDTMQTERSAIAPTTLNRLVRKPAERRGH